jgi:2-oxoglutarate ferredoxin oxidoreductase subunit delta
MEKYEIEINRKAETRRKNRKPSAKKHTIYFLNAFCKACGLCVDVCPSGVLALQDAPENKWGTTIKSSFTEYCIGCRKCEMQCPDFAVFVD